MGSSFLPRRGFSDFLRTPPLSQYLSARQALPWLLRESLSASMPSKRPSRRKTQRPSSPFPLLADWELRSRRQNDLPKDEPPTAGRRPHGTCQPPAHCGCGRRGDGVQTAETEPPLLPSAVCSVLRLKQRILKAIS